MIKYHGSLDNTRYAVGLMLQALLAAHNSIIKGVSEEEMFQVGTTTIAGGVVIRAEPDNKPSNTAAVPSTKWIFVSCSLGDCKAYLLSSKKGTLEEITAGNRQNVSNASDCGGRLGPHLQGGSPDLRNLAVRLQECESGDILFLCTDGVHDNFDPHALGKTPADLGIQVEGNTWTAVDKLETEKLSESYNKVNQFSLELCKKTIMSGSDPKLGASSITPQQVCNRLIEYCQKTTNRIVEFMEKNTSQKQPADYLAFPGKVDHTTCVAFRVPK